MRNKLLTLSLLLILLAAPFMRADEGMWIPILIEKYNIHLMQEKGFKLSAEDIYSVNRACMKDAIVIFGGGCTGELISPDGLLITNHHCGYGQIQSHSTLENDYLTNGFWAMSGDEELPNPGLSVTFLKWMEDVTEQVLKGTGSSLNPSDNEKIIDTNISDIRTEATRGTGYTSVVRPFYMGNQYFLFVYETYNDVRLVGAPPSSIGKFGGETDNWVWPRHTGDFSLFRVYAGRENKPAAYSKDNVPYKPAYHFPVSLKGVKEGDFTMVFGYPGTTSQYVPSYHIDMVKNHINPKMIELRTAKIDIMEEAMNSDPLIRIQYSSKKSGVANAWKRWIGENQGLERMKTVEKKQEYEKRITEWISSDPDRKARWGNILQRYSQLYAELRDYSLVNTYTNDVFFARGAEAVGFARNIRALATLYEAEPESEKISSLKEYLISSGRNFFRDYDRETDKKLFVAMMTMYGNNISTGWQVPEYISFHNSCKGNFASVADKLYARTIFADEDKYVRFIEGFGRNSIGKLRSDPFYNMSVGAASFIETRLRPDMSRINSELQALNKEYMTAQMEFEKGRLFYPDANSTLRVAYGNIGGYFSRDAVYHTHYTTLKGIMEKDNPAIYDYDVPEKLRKLYREKDFGRYTQDGEVPVCFIANNHTTGGNSGSPVINADGHLIGINFDRAWEGVASDLAFNPEQSRNISIDIRYALFIIDKFAGAGYLLDEMTIIEAEGGKSSE
ncbi:MAG: S46 family peptidase [Bacteroidales bacterium]